MTYPHDALLTEILDQQPTHLSSRPASTTIWRNRGFIPVTVASRFSPESREARGIVQDRKSARDGRIIGLNEKRHRLRVSMAVHRVLLHDRRLLAHSIPQSPQRLVNIQHNYRASTRTSRSRRAIQTPTARSRRARSGGEVHCLRNPAAPY